MIFDDIVNSSVQKEMFASLVSFYKELINEFVRQGFFYDTAVDLSKHFVENIFFRRDEK